MTAAEKILQKALVASSIGSGEWNRVQAALRDRAFFSSRVTEARILHELRENVAAIADGRKSPSEMRRDMRELLGSIGYDPGDRRGTIGDLLTKRRLDVIMDVNVRQARGFAQHLEATTGGALKAFPAYELVRVQERRAKRDWHARWAAAGGALHGGRMIALKTDPIWSNISTFGTPYPPFDYNSGMGVQDVSRSECIELGVIDPDEAPQEAPALDFNGGLTASVPFANDDDWQFLKKSFGDQVQIDRTTGSIKWRDEIFRENFEKGNFAFRLGEATNDLLASLPKTINPASVRGKALVVDQDYLNKTRDDGSDHRNHFRPNPDHPEDIPLEVRDMALLPSMWRKPDRVFESHGRLVLEIDAFDGSIYRAVVDVKSDPRLKTFYRTTEPYKTKGPDL